MAGYALNYLIIMLSITAFIAPFYGWYYYKHRPALHSMADFNHSIAHFFESKPSNWLVMSWAAAEAVVWFVIPEFLLLLVIFMRVHRKRQMLLYDIYGTVIGTLAGIWLSFNAVLVERLPYVQPAMVADVQRWYQDEGVLALLHQPFSGVPYKVFTHLMGDYNLSIILFILLAVTVRIARYMIAYGIGVAAYPALHRYVARNYFYLYIGTIFVFAVLLYRVYTTF